MKNTYKKLGIFIGIVLISTHFVVKSTQADTISSLPQWILGSNGILRTASTTAVVKGASYNASSTATSTGAGGWNITGGCFAINGVCVGGSNLSGSGAATEVAFWNSATGLTSTTSFYWNNTTGALLVGTTTQILGAKAIFNQSGTNQLTSAGALAIDRQNVTASGLYSSYGLSTGYGQIISSGVTNTGQVTGFQSGMYRNDVADAGTLTNLRAFWTEFGHTSSVNSSAVTTNAEGWAMRPLIQAGTITNMYGIRFTDILTGGTVVNSYGISINIPTGSTKTVAFETLAGDTVLNENSGDWDFRVESNNDANALLVDGGTDSVGIGTSTPGGKLHVYQTASDEVSIFERTGANGGGAIAPMILTTDAKTVGDGSLFTFSMLDSGGAAQSYGQFGTYIVDPTAGTEDSAMRFVTSANGVNDFRMSIDGTNLGIGTTTPGTMLSVGASNGINISPTGTSTFGTSAKGIDIRAGCFAINGVCVGVGAVNSGTAGQFAFYNTTGSTVSGTSTIFVNTTNSFVGIGTASPSAGLDIQVASTSIAADSYVAVGGNQSRFNADGAGVTTTLTSSTTKSTITSASGSITRTLYYQALDVSTQHGMPVTIRSCTLYFTIGGTGTPSIDSNRWYTINGTGVETDIDNDTTDITSGTSHVSAISGTQLKNGEALMLEVVPKETSVGVPVTGVIQITKVECNYDTD